MAINNVITQREKALDMKERSILFAKELDFRINDLQETLNQAVLAGFPEDIKETYQGRYFDTTHGIIDDLRDTILRDHVDFLERVIAHLTDTINQE